MKLLLSIAIALIVAMSSSLFAETIITKDNFGLKTNGTAKLYNFQPLTISAPSTGSNQVWDLTNLSGDVIVSFDTLHDATMDDFYTEASYYFEQNYSLSSFAFVSKNFVGINDNSCFAIGRRFDEAVFSLAALTGGANDNLTIVGGNNPFEGQNDVLQFPLKEGSTWTQTYKVNTNYKLTIAAYGLKSVPGLFQSTHTQTRTVVGSGTLKIPDKDGTTMEIDALLLKVERNRVDSTYLAGLPAPVQLMDAFGITQGAVETNVSYYFYAPGYGRSLAYYDITNGRMGFTAFDTPTDVPTVAESKLNIFPNPVKAGDKLSIENAEPNIANIKLIDQTGKVVFSSEVLGNSIMVPSYLSSGAYLLQTTDKKGTISSINKIIIE